jgi:MoaA/NifB/PqqE/SkfB family radical SAM enzyme
MNSLQISNIVGFHIELTNMCTLKCAGCARTRFIQQWPGHWNNHNIDSNALFKFLNIDLTDKKINICGNYGDPIYHPDFIDIVREFKRRGSNVSIVTNGSYRKSEWWAELCDLLTEHDQVCFSIDGVPDNFTQYRVNADWKSIQTGIQICAKSRCQTTWKYIVFSYNQTDIEQARDLSISLGIDKFTAEFSDRFDDATDHLKPQDHLIGKRYQSQIHFKSSIKINNLNPSCSNNQEHYISADGFYMPCCYIGDHRFYYKTQFGKDKKNYSIHNQTLSEIIAKPNTLTFYKTIPEQSVCQYNCPSTE